jgi:hypothetical protein
MVVQIGILTAREVKYSYIKLITNRSCSWLIILTVKK